jgi:hypothetical protein
VPIKEPTDAHDVNFGSGEEQLHFIVLFNAAFLAIKNICLGGFLLWHLEVLTLLTCRASLAESSGGWTELNPD